MFHILFFVTFTHDWAWLVYDRHLVDLSIDRSIDQLSFAIKATSTSTKIIKKLL